MQRIKDIWVNILGSVFLLLGDVFSKYDSVFWFGDLNFRIDKGRNIVEDLVIFIIEQEYLNFEFFLEGDEFNDCIVKGEDREGMCLLQVMLRDQGRDYIC